MITTRQVSFAAAAILSLVALVPANAADRAIRGGRLLVRDPVAANPASRKLAVTARSEAAVPLVGDPSASGSGALLTIDLEGALAQQRSFFLAQGTTLAGKSFWKATSGQGFRYSDPDGQQGPVRALVLRRRGSGKIKWNAKLAAAAHPLDLVPPNPGTAAMATLEISDGDRYCARFGAEGSVRNVADRLFRVSRPTVLGCPSGTVSGEILALSYNVAGLPQGISGSDPAVNTPLIAPLLNDYDLVLMQESWLTPIPNPLAPTRTYHEILEAGSELPFRSIAAEAPFGTDPTRPTALLADGLNRFSRFPFGPLTRVRWSDCHTTSADCLAQKGFTFARTTFAPGVEVDVYNLHMEAGGAPEDDAIRGVAITQLVDAMTTVSAGRPIIIGGDFNLHIEDEPDATQYQRLLDDAGLTDVCAVFACSESTRIDKFAFRSGGGITLTPLSRNFETSVFQRGDGEPLSDHDALAVRFRWGRAAL